MIIKTYKLQCEKVFETEKSCGYFWIFLRLWRVKPIYADIARKHYLILAIGFKIKEKEAV
jgi:hypothetical protein